MKKSSESVAYIFVFLNIVLIFSVAASFYSLPLDADISDVYFNPMCGDGVCEVDVGSPGDTSQTSEIYLVDGPGISEPYTNNGATYRDVLDSNEMVFRMSPDQSLLDEYGQFAYDVIIEVYYLDEIDETDCTHTDSRSDCRPYVETTVSYDDLTRVALDRGLGGANTGNYETQKFFIGSYPWTPLQVVNGFMEFRIVNPPQNSVQSGLPIDRVAVRVVAKEVYHNEFDQDRSERGMSRLDYVEEGTLDPSLEQESFVVFSRHYLEEIYPNTIPDVNEVVDGLSLFEIAGNYEPTPFAVHAPNGVDDLSVSVSNLSGGGGEILSDNVTIQVVRYLDRQLTQPYGQKYALSPTYMEPFEGVDVPAGETRQVWITVYVPKGTNAGTYSGEVNVSAEGEDFLFPLSVDVYDVSLDEPFTLSHMWHDPWLNSKHFAINEEVAAEDMAAHNTPPVLYTTPRPDSDIFVFHDSLDYFWSETFKYGGFGVNWDSYCPEIEIFREPCPAYDGEVKRKVIEFNNGSQEILDSEIIFTFEDEPGISDRRYRAHYLSNLVIEAGGKTWQTYYPNNEKPLAGHYFDFQAEDGVFLERHVPDWLKSDSSLYAYWPFDVDGRDMSGNGFDTSINGDAAVTGSRLFLDGEDDYADVISSISMPTSDFSFSIWFNLDITASDAGENQYLMRSGSWNLFQHQANNFIYFIGPAGAQFLGWAPGANEWHHLACSVGDNLEDLVCMGDGQRIYPSQYSGDTPESDWLSISRSGGEAWDGGIDEVMLFSRAFSDEEISQLSTDLFDFSSDNVIEISTTFDASEGVNSIWFTLDDEFVDSRLPGDQESVKRVLVNGEEVFSTTKLTHEFEKFDVDFSGSIIDGENTLTFELRNALAREENLTFYIIDDFLRNREWTMSQSSGDWLYEHVPDLSGAAGPMGPVLTHKIYAPNYVGDYQRSLTEEESIYGYYNVYLVNEPYSINSRFFHGYYPAAVNARMIAVYAYGDWGAMPYEMESFRKARITGGSSVANAFIRGQGPYHLPLPTRENRMQNTLTYESLREGVEDSRIYAALLLAIKENPGSTAQDAQAFIDSIFENVDGDLDYYWRADEDDDSVNYGNRAEEMLTDLGANSSDNYWYLDNVRRQMIEYIIALENSRDVVIVNTNTNNNNGPQGPSIQPACSDGLDNDGDGLIDYPDDKGCNSLSDNSELYLEQPAGPGVCEELWDCGTWGDCVDGVETRECTDLRECGTEGNKPDIERFCDQNANIDQINYSVIFVLGVLIISVVGVLVSFRIYYLRRRFKLK